MRRGADDTASIGARLCEWICVPIRVATLDTKQRKHAEYALIQSHGILNPPKVYELLNSLSRHRRVFPREPLLSSKARKLVRLRAGLKADGSSSSSFRRSVHTSQHVECLEQEKAGGEGVPRVCCN